MKDPRPKSFWWYARWWLARPQCLFFDHRYRTGVRVSARALRIVCLRCNTEMVVFSGIQGVPDGAALPWEAVRELYESFRALDR